MNPLFAQALVEVWRQALTENAAVVELGKDRYRLRRTPKRGLRQVTSFSTEARFVDWSRTLIRNPGGRSWHSLAVTLEACGAALYRCRISRPSCLTLRGACNTLRPHYV